MMIILTPQRVDADLTVVKMGDVLTINGEVFDFSALPDGAALPAGAVACPWIAGAVERIDGQLVVPLILPHGPNPSQHVAFPVPISVVPDGPVILP